MKKSSDGSLFDTPTTLGSGTSSKLNVDAAAEAKDVPKSKSTKPRSARVAKTAGKAVDQVSVSGTPEPSRAKKTFKPGEIADTMESVAVLPQATEHGDTNAGGAAVTDVDQSYDQKTSRFLKWLQQHGATLPSLKIGTDDLRGIHAMEPIVNGELVMHIPHHLMLTLELSKASASGKLIVTHGVHVSDYGYMAAFLLEIKRDGGFWKPYVDMMPQDVSDHPLFFSPTELEYLKGSYTLPMIQEQQNWLAYEYKQILSCFPKGQAFTCQEFAWARCMVMTRTYTVTIKTTKSLAMVPLADMLNHADNADVIWTGEATFGFSLYADHDLSAGRHLYESYGRRCNGRLFVHHGFCLSENEDNEAEISIPSPLPAHPFYAYTKELGTLRDDMRVFKVKRKCDSDGVTLLFSMLRLGCLEDMPGIYRTMVNGAKAEAVPPISRKNEIAALTALASACQRSLNRFDTTIEQDNALLADDSLPSKLRYAVIVRRGEKAVLKHYLDLAQMAIPVLQNPFCDLRDYSSSEPRFADYFRLLSQHLGMSMD